MKTIYSSADGAGQVFEVEESAKDSLRFSVKDTSFIKQGASRSAVISVEEIERLMIVLEVQLQKMKGTQ
jgi:hypothetical protein